METLLKYFCTFFTAAFIILFSILPHKVHAQQNETDEEELLQALKKVFKQDFLSIEILLQAQGEFHIETENPAENTFRIPNARLKVFGNLDRKISYAVQADFSSSPALLDATLGVGGSAASVTVGAQKPVFSGEFLTSNKNTDFIDRSRIVETLAGSRDVGVMGKVKLTEGLDFSAGVYNGTNQNLENSNNQFYYTARLKAGRQINPELYFEMAFNAAYGEDNGVSIGKGRLPDINGERVLAGGDTRLEAGRWLLSGEFLFAELEYGPGRIDEVMGFHATAGYWVFENVQLLGRFDYLDSELVDFTSNVVLAGVNFNYTKAASFQLNYRLNPDDLDFSNQFILLQSQISF